mgnify:CR=1 FL=1
MNRRAKKLAERLRAFVDDVNAFVEGCSEKDWKKVCTAEEWPVGVTARTPPKMRWPAILRGPGARDDPAKPRPDPRLEEVR